MSMTWILIAMLASAALFVALAFLAFYHPGQPINQEHPLPLDSEGQTWTWPAAREHRPRHRAESLDETQALRWYEQPESEDGPEQPIK